MKHIFVLDNTVSSVWLERIPETTGVLLTGQPFTDRVQVFVPVGFLNKSEDLATQIGAYVHGRRWGTISRNDGHYIEVTTEDHEGGPASGPNNPQS